MLLFRKLYAYTIFLFSDSKKVRLKKQPLKTATKLQVYDDSLYQNEKLNN